MTTSEQSYDVVIAGGGFAGLAVARNLTGSGLRVLVVEAGPDAGHRHYRSEFSGPEADARWLRPETDPHFWQSYDTTGPGFGGIAGLRRRLGGRSLYWHGVVVPIEGWALAEGWPAAVVHDLTTRWQGGPGLYDRVEAELAAWAHGALAPGDPVELAGHRFTPTPRAVRRAAGGASSVGWEAYSPLPELADDIQVLSDGHVIEVLRSGAAAAGVRVATAVGVREIRAPRVVLAAGTVENSRLAIQLLAPDGRLPTPVLPGLVDKIAQGFVATFVPDDLPAGLRRAARVGGSFRAPGCEALRSGVFVIASTNDAGVAVVDVYLMGEQLRGTSGEVSCEPRPQPPWPVTVRCEPGPADAPVIEGQRAELRRIWQELSALTSAPAAELPFSNGAFGTPDLAEALLRGGRMDAPDAPYTYAFPLGSELHEAGTLPFGPILDDQQQFRDVPGLFAAGPCCFPRTGAANPVLTILALSVRLAAHLRGERGA